MRVLLFVSILLMSFQSISAAVTTDDRSTITTSLNTFACNLFGKLAAGDANKNLFFSPFSMSSALAMTAEGARGKTAEEMGAALGLNEAARSGNAMQPWDFSLLHAAMGELNERLTGHPASPEIAARVATLREQIDAIHKQLAAAKTYDAATAKLSEKSQEFGDKLNKLLPQIDQFELRSANALWGEKSFTFEKPYLDTIAKFYKTGGLFPVDFHHDPEAARVTINSWVSQQTNEHIKDLIGPRMLNEETRLVLTNAIYFKGDWADPFETEQTKESPFKLSDGVSKTVQLMHKFASKGASYAAFNADGSVFATPDRVAIDDRNSSKNYPAADGFQLLSLPYRGGELSMVVLLPNAAGGLNSLESKLTGEILSSWIDASKPRGVDVYLPKFKLQTAYQMNGPLNALGIHRAFVEPEKPDGADFSGINSSQDPKQKLFIGMVVHKAFVDVNEQGTEAAAATGVMMPTAAAMHRDVPFVPVFRADHPFVFMIRDNVSGAVLFIGRMAKPEKQ